MSDLTDGPLVAVDGRYLAEARRLRAAWQLGGRWRFPDFAIKGGDSAPLHTAPLWGDETYGGGDTDQENCQISMRGLVVGVVLAVPLWCALLLSVIWLLHL